MRNVPVSKDQLKEPGSNIDYLYKSEIRINLYKFCNYSAKISCLPFPGSCNCLAVLHMASNGTIRYSMPMRSGPIGVK